MFYKILTLQSNKIFSNETRILVYGENYILKGIITNFQKYDLNNTWIENSNYSLFVEIEIQLNLFFNGKIKKFDIDFELGGTQFQQKVFKRTLLIPYGDVTTYKDLANELGSPNSYRAVGNALGTNKLLFLIPCHRVVGLKNKLGGFSSGIEIKKKLLELEKSDD